MATTRFENYSTLTKQVLVDYTANSLAPYTLLECLCDVGKDDNTTGMKLIYDYINSDINKSTTTNTISSLSDKQYLLVWDNTDEATNSSKFKVLGLGTSGSAGSGSDSATSVFGQDGQFHNRVKYADCIYNSSASTQSIYIPYTSIGTTTDIQNPGFIAVPTANDSQQTKALVVKNGALQWGSAGAELENVTNTQDSVLFYLVGNSVNSASKIAPDTLYYDTRVYFKNGSLYHTSDETLKTFTDDIDINLDNLATIKKGMFYWNSDPDKISHLGVSAQTVEALYPELVSSDEGRLSVDYSKLGVVALAAIDKLNERIKELEKQIEDLKK